MNKTLYVIAVISNPVRYKSRYKLYNDFAKHVQDAGAVLVTVEAAYGDRPHEVTTSTNPLHIQVRVEDELWHKENMINLGISRLPSDWEYVAWIDADVVFTRPDWVQETIHQLQHYDVVQMFSETIDIDDTYHIVNKNGSYRTKGMVYNYIHNDVDIVDAYHKHTGHCGYAWAATRFAIETVDLLLDFAILGSADFHMACAFLSDIEISINHQFSDEYKKALRQWGKRAKKLRHNVGYVEGLLVHNWHGKKSSRGYQTRWKVLVEHQYDPTKDIRKDWQGMLYLVDHEDDRSYKLRNDLRKYFRSRNEDEPNTKD